MRKPVFRKSRARSTMSARQGLCRGKGRPRRSKSKTGAGMPGLPKLFSSRDAPMLVVAVTGSKDRGPAQFKPEADVVALRRAKHRGSSPASDLEISSDSAVESEQAGECKVGSKPGCTRSSAGAGISGLPADSRGVINPACENE